MKRKEFRSHDFVLNSWIVLNYSSRSFFRFSIEDNNTESPFVSIQSAPRHKNDALGDKALQIGKMLSNQSLFMLGRGIGEHRDPHCLNSIQKRAHCLNFSRHLTIQS